MLTDTGIQVDVDLALTVPCSLRRRWDKRPICDQPAAWAVRLSCCGYVKEVCQRHRDLDPPLKLACQACLSQRPLVVARWPI